LRGAISSRAEAIPLLAEVFREHGYEGASLARITAATGLGKGSLYHFFPGGKEEMAVAVLSEIDAWFETHVFAPLRSPDDPRAAIADMFASASAYFRSGRRVCLVGAIALADTRDMFAAAVRDYFQRWIRALSDALQLTGTPRPVADAAAEEVVSGIQGAIVLARALNDSRAFDRAVARLKERLR
jgi:TetR/AcrR family transcriptional regulator, lmrAB and yxaGH operons repressor